MIKAKEVEKISDYKCGYYATYVLEYIGISPDNIFLDTRQKQASSW
jgi:hypothetical protein